MLTEKTGDSIEKNEFEMKIYHRSNYLYYLVQSYNLPEKCADYALDPSRPYHLTIALKNSCIYNFEWIFEEDSLESSSIEVFAVINGAKLMCTPYDELIVPPPMSFYEIDLEEPILYRCMSGINLFLFTQSSIIVYECVSDIPVGCVLNRQFSYGKTTFNYKKFPQLLQKFHYSSLLSPICFLPFNWVALTKNIICCIIESKNETSAQQVLLLELDYVTCSVKVKKTFELPSDELCFALAASSDLVTDTLYEAYLSLSSGKIMKLSGNDLSFISTEFPKPCNHIKTFVVNEVCIIFGCANNRYLYLNETLISEEATSFSIQTNKFLLFTTQSHRLFIVALNDLIGSDKTDSSQWYSRKIERGAKISGVVQKGTSVLLQMPRGNLECIHPKPLLINLIEQQLQEKQFLEAFKV